MGQSKVPARAWIVTFAGTAVNLCLGILYAWSVWKANLIADADHPAGSPMNGLNEGWVYLTDAQATWAYAICGFMFALYMIPGGRLQDRYGPKLGVTLGGVCLAGGCILAGLLKSYTGLILGFGILGGMGMGFGDAAATPAAVKWFGPNQRGLIVGLVVGVAYWQYGGGLSLMPAFTADYFGSKNLGLNYGLVFIGWGCAFFVPQLAGYIKDLSGSLDYAFYLSGGLLVVSVLVSRFLRRPMEEGETRKEQEGAVYPGA
jgi:OFA family oxalate/formate antiporter-like MFS transporter